jgi:hypothetical protein
MARRRANRQARKRLKSALLLGKRIGIGKPVPLGGGLFAAVETTRGIGANSYRLEFSLRTRGAGDLKIVLSTNWRHSLPEVTKDGEEVLIHLASALRQAGAT